jgi:Domain of unknown function (DUF6268)
MKVDFRMMVVIVGVVMLLTGGLHAVMLDTSYTYLEPDDGDFEDEVEQHEFKAGASWPVIHKEDAGWDLAVGGAFQVNTWCFDDDRIDGVELYKIKVPLVAGFDATDDILVTLGLTPGIHSDLEDVDGDDFRVDGMAFGTYVYSPELHFVLGAALGEEFGDPELYPLFGVWWQATDELLLNLVFPRPRVSYAFSEDFRLFVAGEPAGGEWNVDSDVGEVDVQQKGWRTGIGGEYQVTDGGWLYVMAGREVDRELQVAVDEDEVFDDDVDLDDSNFVQIGFRLVN